MTQRGYAPRVRREANGYQAERWFRVDTHDELIALSAAGLPQYGDSWDLTAPNLKVVGFETEYPGGQNDGVTGTGGLTYVRVTYETPGLNGSLPVIGTQYTEIVCSVGSVNVDMDIREEITAGDAPDKLNNGVGFTKKVGQLQLQIVTWPTTIDIVRLADLVADQAVNTDPVTTPPILGTGITLNFSAGSLSYCVFDLRAEGGSARLTHTIDVGRDWLARAKAENAQGRFTGPVIASKLYRELPFAGLW